MAKTIRASEGHFLTNGTVYGSVIHLADDMDAAEFREVPEAEYYENLGKEADREELGDEVREKAKAYDIITGVSE